jgi:hypothetical protein
MARTEKFCYNEYGLQFENGIEDYKPLNLPYLEYLKLHLEAAYPRYYISL